MIKCPEDLKIELDNYIHGDYDFDNPEWIDGAFKIISKYYDDNPPPKICEWNSCNKKRYAYNVNMAGDIVYCLCKEHFKWYKEHVRTFSILKG